MTKKTSQSTLVITAISLLYLVNIVDLAVEWFFLKVVFITNGETRSTAFGAVSQTVALQTLLSDIFTTIVFVVADGLLVRIPFKGAFRC